MESEAIGYESPHIHLCPSDELGIKTLDVPIPYNEALRLQVLRDSGILFSNPQDPDFDRVSALAARVLKCPIGMINLMDSTNMWIKSKYGPPAIMSLSDSPRIGTYCTYTILPESPDVFIVLDAMKDERFKHRDGPKMGIVFYAGAPIILDDMKIGTLCALDAAPRESFSMDDRTNLLDFAASVSILIKKYRDYNIGMARERSRMLFDLSHNLRTPLTSLELIVKNMKNDHSSFTPHDNDTHGSYTESTKQKRANRQKQTKWNIDDAEMAVRQLNMVVENSLSAVRVVLCSDGMESNNDELCQILKTIGNIQYITSSLDSEGEKFVWNVQKLQTQFEYSEQQTYPEVLKFAIISLLRQLYTNWEQITIDFDYIYNTSQNIVTDSIIDGSLSVCVSVSSTIHQSSMQNNTKNREDTSYYAKNRISFNDDDKFQRRSLRTTPEDSDNIPLDGSPNKVKSTKLNPSATATASVSMKSSYSTLDMDEYISSLDLTAMKQSIKSIQGVFEVMVTDPLLNCTSEIEFRIWIPCRVYKASVDESSLNNTIITTTTATSTTVNTISTADSSRNDSNRIVSILCDENDHYPYTTQQQQQQKQQQLKSSYDPLHLSSSAVTTTTSMSQLLTEIKSSRQYAVVDPPMLPKSSLRVLIIEDSIPIQKAMSRYLTKAGCDVTCADNGRLGLIQLQSSPFDMILVDFLMPVMSGMEVFERRYKWMKEQRSSMKISTITTTSDQNSQDKDSNDSILNESALMIGMSATALPAECASSFDMGMHFFVAKPISAEIMNTLVESIKRRRSEQHARDMSHTSQMQTPTSASQPSAPIKYDHKICHSTSSPLHTALTYIKYSAHCKEYVNMNQAGSHRFGVIISHANEVTKRNQMLDSAKTLESKVRSLASVEVTVSDKTEKNHINISSDVEVNHTVPQISALSDDSDTYHNGATQTPNNQILETISRNNGILSESSTKSANRMSWFSNILGVK